MATNYLSASLLSTTYQNMLDADNREREKQMETAFLKASLNRDEVDARNLLRDENGFLISFSDEENNSTEEYYQLSQVQNKKNIVEKHLLKSVLKEKIEFKQYKPTETAPSDAELLELEVVLREKIKLYEQLIQDAQSTD
tara:strand:+ start:702 stop:1121 length:420 start_codon:yes stop_codon:yes gene_type:complete